MKKHIIANIKMNQTPEESKFYLASIISKASALVDKRLTICLPYTSLNLGKMMLSGTEITLGAQNIAEEEEGLLTGEISGRMLKGCGVKRVIVGHSERRSRFKESGQAINKKIKIALKNGLQVILCVGESLVEKNTLKTVASLTAQIDECLKGLYENELENIIIAYEPVWAIGSGKTASVKDIEYGVKAIRKAVENNFSEKAGKEIEVVYGGSLNGKNITSIYNAEGLNGVLVGGACLDAQAFLRMISKC